MSDDYQLGSREVMALVFGVATITNDVLSVVSA